MHKQSLTLAVLTALGAVGVAVALGWGAVSNAAESGNKPQMDLVISIGGEEVCRSNPNNEPSVAKCDLEEDQAFTVSVAASIVPNSDPNGDGYSGWGTMVEYGSLNYVDEDTGMAADEIKFPEGVLPLRVRPVDYSDTSIAHANSTGLVPPLPLSTQKTPLVNMSFTCSVPNQLVELIPRSEHGNGAEMILSDAATSITPNVGDIEINCVEPPTPTPTDEPGTPTDTPTITPTPEVECGDVTGDGIVNSVDALWILWLVADIVDDVSHPEAADVNGDGMINSIDAALVLQYVAALLDDLTC